METHRKFGGIRVELTQSINYAGRNIDAIEIRPATLDHIIRWGERKIPSTLALLSELSGVAEGALRQIVSGDIDRVMIAFTQVMPTTIRKDFENGARPLATPVGMEVEPEVVLGADDPIDPRFPRVDGKVERAAPSMPNLRRNKPPELEDDGSGLAAAPPTAVKAVS